MGIISNWFGQASRPAAPQASNRAAERQDRLQRYKKSWEAYLAELPDPIVRDPHSKTNDNVKVNPARAIVDTSVYFLFGDELKFQVSPTAGETFGKAQAEGKNEPTVSEQNPAWLQDLNKCWKANRKQRFLFNLGKSGAIHGDVFVKIVPNAAGLANEFPRFIALDPANVDVEWDPNDCDQEIKFVIEYMTEDELGHPLLRTQEIWANQDESGVTQNWSMQDFEQKMQWDILAGWHVNTEEGDTRVPVTEEEVWEYAWPPIEHCQNIELPHMYWGMPDLDESSVEVIESLQRAMSSLNKIVRVHASPRMFAKNVMPDQIDEIDVSADNIITLPNMESDLNVLNSLQNLTPSIQFTDKLREDLYRMLQVPAIALGEFESASTSVSGITLSILYAPILQKTELKRISYGDMIERLNQKSLILMGHTDPTEYEGLIVVWPEAMPGSQFLERQTIQQDLSMGLSKWSTMARLGYDPQDEEVRRLKELADETKVVEETKVETQMPVMEMQAEQAAKTAEMQADREDKRAKENADAKTAAVASTDKPKAGGNNNPAGRGGESGSMGGTKSAGVPKNSKNQK